MEQRRRHWQGHLLRLCLRRGKWIGDGHDARTKSGVACSASDRECRCSSSVRRVNKISSWRRNHNNNSDRTQRDNRWWFFCGPFQYFGLPTSQGSAKWGRPAVNRTRRLGNAVHKHTSSSRSRGAPRSLCPEPKCSMSTSLLTEMHHGHRAEITAPPSVAGRNLSRCL